MLPVNKPQTDSRVLAPPSAMAVRGSESLFGTDGEVRKLEIGPLTQFIARLFSGTLSPFVLVAAPLKMVFRSPNAVHTVDGQNPFRTTEETMGSLCLLVFTWESSFQGFSGGAGFCPSTVGFLMVSR